MANRLATRNRLNASAYSGRPSSLRITTGIAVPTAMASNATSEITATIPQVRLRYGAARIRGGDTAGGSARSSRTRSEGSAEGTPQA